MDYLAAEQADPGCVRGTEEALMQGARDDLRFYTGQAKGLIRGSDKGQATHGCS